MAVRPHLTMGLPLSVEGQLTNATIATRRCVVRVDSYSMRVWYGRRQSPLVLAHMGSVPRAAEA